MKNLLILGALLALAIPTSMAQSGQVEGLVQSQSGPVPFAHVQVNKPSRGTVADSLGRFVLSDLPAGQVTIQTSAVGYLSRNKSVVIEAGKTTTVTLDLAEDVSQLEAVVVTGTMREVSKLSSPIPVEVYSPAFFRKNPTPNIFESLAIINGVQPQINCNVCNTGDIHINGLEGPYTMILIDGMPIVSSLSTVYGLSGIPNSLVKRMEIVKGPASALYGSEAVAGVINIITREPQSAPLFKADVFGTSLGEYNTDVTTAWSAGKASAMLGVNYFNYQQPIDINGDNFTDVTLQQRISLFNKWNFPHTPAGAASLAVRYVYEDRWGGEMQWTPAYRGTDIYYGETIQTNRFEMIGNQRLSAQGTLQLDYSFNDHRQDSYYGRVHYEGRQQVAFAQMRWQQLRGNHNLLAGLPLRYVFYNDNTPGTSDPNGDHPSITWLPGLFIQDEWQSSKSISLLGGFRYDHHNLHGNILTERISLKYQPDANSTLRVTGGSGFRVINLFTEDHAALTGSRTVVIKNDLQPEQSWNVNINYARNLSLGHSVLNLDGSLFYTYFTNKIVGDFNSDPNLIIYDNLNGYAVSQGLTLNTDLSFASGARLLAGLTWMDVYRVDQATGGTHIPQLHAPRWSGTFSASHGWKGWSVDLSGKINGPMYLPVVPNDFRPSQSPWYALVNVQLTHRLGPQWEFYGGIKNIFNFIPSNPLLRPFDPFDKNVAVDNPNNYTFDTNYNYAPMQGAKMFLGVRYTLERN